MNVEIGTETPILLFWEYLFRNFGILSWTQESIPPICRTGRQAELISWNRYLSPYL
jgi:hypothetical protein